MKKNNEGRNAVSSTEQKDDFVKILTPFETKGQCEAIIERRPVIQKDNLVLAMGDAWLPN